MVETLQNREYFTINMKKAIRRQGMQKVKEEQALEGTPSEK